MINPSEKPDMNQMHDMPTPMNNKALLAACIILIVILVTVVKVIIEISKEWH